MGLPAQLPAISVYAGDPLVVTLTFNNTNLMAYSHVAQLRASAAAPTTLATWTLTKALVGSNTVITLSMLGDSSAGPDSITRRLGANAVWDLQQNNPDGSASDTLVVGSVSVVSDVTR